MSIESWIDHQNEDTVPTPMLPTLQRDEKTGLWQWPILLNGDYSQWTNEPCAILFAHAFWGDALWQMVSAELLSDKWPRLWSFRVDVCDLLILAPNYSIEQALLLAEDLNRQISRFASSSATHRAHMEFPLIWGIAVASSPWNMVCALSEAVAQQEEAWEEVRVGSINISEKTRFDSCFDLAVFTQRDVRTHLWMRPLIFAAPCGKRESATVLMGDVVNVRKINDKHGFPAGDAALVAVADTLRPFQSSDTALFSHGRNEFTFLLRDCSQEHAETMAGEINAQLATREWKTDDCGPFSGLSLTWGGVVASPDKADFPQMLRRADELMFAAKEERRGSVKIETW